MLVATTRKQKHRSNIARDLIKQNIGSDSLDNEKVEGSEDDHHVVLSNDTL